MTDEEYKQRQTDFVEEQTKMARQKQIAPEAIEPIPMNEVATATPMQSPSERDLANQLVGRAQMGSVMSKLVTVTTLMTLKQIKESNGYKGLTIPLDGKLVTVTTWTEFCRGLGRSREQVDQDLLNLDSFGAAAFEALQEMGVGYRQFRQLRKLPEDERNVIIEQITQDTTDKDALNRNILELIQVQSRVNDEKLKEVEAKAEAAARALEVKDRVIAQKTAEIQKRDKTVAELEAANAELLGSDNGVDGIDILNNKLADKLSSLVNSVLSVDMMRLRKQIIEIQQANAPEHIQLQCGQAVVQLIAELQSMQVEYQLEVPSVMNTSWMANIPDDVQD